MIAPLPVLRTDRLTMRPHRLEDFPDTAALWADPEVVRFIGGHPLSREESWARFLRYLGHWTALGFGYWTVRHRRMVQRVHHPSGSRRLDPRRHQGRLRRGTPRGLQGRAYRGADPALIVTAPIPGMRERQPSVTGPTSRHPSAATRR